MKTQIARYDIIRELGRGGMGVVYLAHDPGLNRYVALKVLLDKWTYNADLCNRFKQEAKTMEALKHPAIMPVHELGEQNNQPYIVMPYMSGGSLADHLKRGQMSLPQIEYTLYHLASALDKVHERGWIHRDIKPANILFDEEGRLYLADFGIARPITAGTVTQAGTIKYMSPEQIGGKDLDRRSDVYSLGMVLFKMLTGDLPNRYNVPSVYDYNAGLPQGCDEVIARALATKKEDRYPTAGHFAAEFSAVVKGKPPTRKLGFLPVIATGILLGMAILAAVIFLPPQPATPPIGLIISFTPQVEVKHGEQLKAAEVGLKLFQDDVVIAEANAGAVVSLSCAEDTLLLTVGSQQNMSVDCSTVGDEDLIAQLGPDVITSEARSLLVLPAQQERSSRQAQTPLLLTPRNTLIRESQPTFQWQGVPGASGYRLSLNIPNAENWQVETTDTTLPYPADKAPLPAGGTIIVTLATLDNPSETDETFVDVIDEAALAGLAESEAEIRNLGLDETAQAYLLAQLYRQQEMNAAAIAQLEQIAAKESLISADLWQQLGDLYFEIELYTQAEENYQKALSAAQANDDQQTEALAHFGLAQTAYVFEENEQALDYLTQAETLSDQIGDNVLAEAVVELKERIEGLTN